MDQVSVRNMDFKSAVRGLAGVVMGGGDDVLNPQV